MTKLLLVLGAVCGAVTVYTSWLLADAVKGPWTTRP